MNTVSLREPASTTPTNLDAVATTLAKVAEALTHVVQALSTRSPTSSSEAAALDGEVRNLRALIGSLERERARLAEVERRQEALEYLNLGRARLITAQNEHDISDAIRVVTQALQVDPSVDNVNVEALLEEANRRLQRFRAQADRKHHGLIALEAGRWEEAAALLQDAYDLDSTDSEVAVALRQVREKVEAQREIRALLSAGRQAFHRGDYLRALEQFSMLLGRDPDHEEAKSLLAEAKQRHEALQAEAEQGRQQQEQEIARQYDRRRTVLEALVRGPALPIELAAVTLSLPEEIRPILDELHAEGLITVRRTDSGELIALTASGRRALGR